MYSGDPREVWSCLKTSRCLVKSKYLKSSPPLGLLNRSGILPRGQYAHKTITALKPIRLSCITFNHFTTLKLKKKQN
jgi:hypothetical protein